MQYYNTVDVYLVTRVIAISISMLSNTSYDFLSKEDEAQEQLETAINWGRYAELFAFQDDRGVFRLEEPEPAETV